MAGKQPPRPIHGFERRVVLAWKIVKLADFGQIHDVMTPLPHWCPHDFGARVGAILHNVRVVPTQTTQRLPIPLHKQLIILQIAGYIIMSADLTSTGMVCELSLIHI